MTALSITLFVMLVGVITTLLGGFLVVISLFQDYFPEMGFKILAGGLITTAISLVLLIVVVPLGL